MPGMTMPLEISDWKFSRMACLGAFVFLVALWGNARVCGAAPRKAKRPAKGRMLNFEDHIVPILKSRCFKCHGAKVKKAGLDLRRRFAILKGGDSGQALFAGKPDKSLIVNMVTSREMPPKGQRQLTADQIATLKRWVSQGAAIKGKTETPLKDSAEEADVTQADRRFWAFQPPTKPPVPAVKMIGRARTPVDVFLLAKLERKRAGFNRDASKNVLARRVYFDVLGLPPTPEEVDAFLKDRRPDAYERLVERLLASPRFGERWGRRWLDVAGYADSDGYLAADRIRPEAWRYRDYVIRAHNDDKPFDRFVLEQIAGDELADWRRAKRITPELADNLIATGFLRTALDPTYGNYAEPLECHKVMADTIQIVSSAFLGLTVQCARCHSHKYDPISQTDYYRLNAIFLASYDPNRWQVSLARSIPLATEAEQARIATANRLVRQRVKQLNAEIARLTVDCRGRFLDERLASISDPAVRAKVKAALLLDPKKRNSGQKKLVRQYAPKLKSAESDIAARFPKSRAEMTRLRAAAAAESALTKKIVQLRGLQDLGDKATQAHLLIRGDFKNPGKTVEPGVPVVLTPPNFRFPVRSGYKSTGRRGALARWLVDRRNPLTARVHVNRIWAHYFGRGIVPSLDNFGKAGARPSHPELLDWLAVEFQSRGWSQKALHRLILTSTAYRQSSQPNARLATSDPENVLLGSWRPRRHDGEVIRDTVLAVTGKLNRKMYGPPIPVARHPGGQVSVANTPAGNRASVYVIVRRSQPVTLLELFDTPKMEINCTRRTQSIVVTQSLTMLNSAFAETNARALADRLRAEVPANEDRRLDRMYRLLYSRMPTASERSTIREFLDGIVRANLAKGTTTGPRRAVREAAWDQLALVLLNSNEFLYVH
jgi:Protein of unknown function (DUF1553)/Protein of unknown function (DUF1549)/Planctomycete cytochrome C